MSDERLTPATPPIDPVSEPPRDLEGTDQPTRAVVSRGQLPWLLAAGASLAVIILLVVSVTLGVMWRSASSDAAQLRDEVASFEAADDARAEAEAAVPDLEEIAEETFTSSVYWTGTADYVSVTIRSTGFDQLAEYLAELGFSRAVLERMSKTRALDGTLSEEGKNTEATWTYHPDDGLQVVFETTR